MDEPSWRKAVQKQIYDVISHRYGMLVVIIGVILITVSAFHFGESVVEWSTEKYAAVFNSFSDNLGGRSFRERLCLPVPIDVVYTWVNGTDPQLMLNLKRLKMDMEDELNISRKQVCVFSNCLLSPIVVLDPVLPGNMTLTQLGEKYDAFTHASRMFKVNSPLDNRNFTAVVFTEETHAEAVVNMTMTIDEKNVTIAQCHITSDWTVANSVMLTDVVIMSGYPHLLTSDELKVKLPEKHQKAIEKMELYPDKGLAVLHIPVKADFDTLLAESNFTIDGKEPTLNAANLVWDLRDFSRDEDISSSRFEDNEELRYSIRSVEKFAPWVRHIYIVTNGQLPYWLNLESTRVTIVTHEEIFTNASHLPTFSSPAIESNLHRIPGLSTKFIYMNDDVMFGKEVWPDDFYTHSTGQKVYLTWPVPNCNEGCPSSWIKDGYCDKACNVSECEWDAGDCDGATGQQQAWGGGGGWQADNKGYCNSGCADNWIADRYCDTACNVLPCGFDAGDCGTEKYDQLYGFMLEPNQTQYTLSRGLCHTYFNLTTILKPKGATLHNAFYDDNPVVRTVAVARKYDVITAILNPDHNVTRVNFTVLVVTGNTTTELNFTLTVDTMPRTEIAVIVNVTDKPLPGQNVSMATNGSEVNKTVEEIVTFEETPLEKRNPDILVPSPTPDNSALLQKMPANLSEVPFPPHILKAYTDLELELKEGDVTETGFSLRKNIIWLLYQQYLLSNDSRSEIQNKSKSVNAHHAIQLHDGDRPIIDKQFQREASKSHDQKEPIEKNVSENEAEGEGQNTGNKSLAGIAAGRKLLFTREQWADDQTQNDNMQFENKSEIIDIVDIQPDLGKLFPWEQEGSAVRNLQEQKEKADVLKVFAVSEFHGRKLLDTFGDSLRHVNTLYNKAFGYTPRKVPGHMPHMIDRHIMTELQDRFSAQWEVTSSHKVRSSDDMQYAFSYFYYLMGVKENVSVANVFDEMDTDHSKTLSDRELRTLATRLFDLPLDLPTLTKLEFTFVNCSKTLNDSQVLQPDGGEAEVYYEKEMPQVTRNLFINCPEMVAMVKSRTKQKYRYSIVDDSDIAFKMIKTNVSGVVGQLDEIRKSPKKFICLNDNIDHSQDQARTVKAILQDFYESMFPVQSQLELPRDYRNRFTHIDELREWRQYRDWLKFWTHIALALLVIFTMASFFGDKIEAAQRRFRRRRTLRENNGEGGGGSQGGVVETV